MELPCLIAAFLVLIFFAKLYQHYKRISISLVPGPEPESILLGNMRELFQSQASEADFKWQGEYGDIVRLKGPLGEDRLLVSDPKALQYIYHTAGYKFFKQKARREISRIISGRGIFWADGNDHKRHRRVMLPGFGGPESKSFLPIFSSCAEKLASSWRDLISLSDDGVAVVNVTHWASRATMDAIGEAAFDCHFGALDDADTPLNRAYTNLLTDSFGQLSKADILIQNIMEYLPMRLLNFFSDYMPSQKLSHVRHTAQLATKLARSLVDSKAEALRQGKGRRDIMSLLVKANVSENSSKQLSNEELLAQMRTIILAGHETTANTLSWTLLELCRHPEVQTKLRQEIRDMERTIQQSSALTFTSADYDSMPYLTAVLKEVLRYHPVSYNHFREASRDDVIPLSKPMILTNGEVIDELPIPKGLKIITSVGGYNRNKDIFGSDAHTFNPERWLDPTKIRKLASVGVYGNLLSFSAGVR
ncbi:hypothetical protein AX16_007583 [Volvariella volvacea WC 439]|nr:hypothetical protein AX16_007583 [Volvariella volvacea WC 439]